MIEKEWNDATDQERNDEIERCKDHAYAFNNYFKKPSDPEISSNAWRDIMFNLWFNSIKWRNPTKELYDHFRKKYDNHELPINKID